MGALLLAVAIGLVHGQDPLRIFPNNYHLILENQWVRVLDVKYSAHEKLPIHNHSDKPTVYVYLTDSGPVRFSHVEDHPFSLVRPPEKAGNFRVSPGRLEQHEVENLGNIPTEFLRIELKQVPLGFQNTSFRGVKAFDLSHSGVSTQFPGPFVTIKRVIAANRDVTECQQSDMPALLVAFSPTVVQVEHLAAKPRLLKRGEVLWIDPRCSFRTSSEDTKVAAHLLQIGFASKAQPLHARRN